MYELGHRIGELAIEVGVVSVMAKELSKYISMRELG